MDLRLILLTAALPLAACQPQTDAGGEIRAPKVTVVGEPQNCISVNRIRNTVVHDDYTIDFEMSGNLTYRNTLPQRCYSLGFEERFAYEVRTSQLCNVDTITVLHADGSRGTTCGLGQFLPVELAE